jgi:2-dehydropantoate 2-reductase
MTKKRIVFIGGGGVGAYTAAHLLRGGEDVTVFDPWPENVQAMNAKGIEVRGTTEQEHFIQAVEARPLSEIPQLPNEAPIDIAFMCMKSYDTAWATAMVAPYLAPSGFVVSLQNCINEETIAGVVGWGRTVGCIASLIAVDLHDPAEVRRNVPLGGENHTVFRVGEPHGRITERVEHIASLLRNADSAKTTTNLWGERWSKLAANAMRNALAASTGLAGNAGDADEGQRRFALRLAGETVKVGMAHGNVFEKVYGLEPTVLVEAVDGSASALKSLEDELLGRGIKTGSGHLPSMGQDIRKKRRTEIDYINGFVADKGVEVGIETPANTAITQLVRRVERGEIAPSPEAIQPMVKAVIG